VKLPTRKQSFERQQGDSHSGRAGRRKVVHFMSIFAPLRVALCTAALALAIPGSGLSAQGTSGDSRPYDDKLLRLCEILGAVHYLRELCGADDGQLWRDRMKELIDTEGSSALRRARLTRSFNNGYRSYSRTYNTCSASAQTAMNRFLAEGAEIASSLVKSAP
jgi:uncharacterized protein (TIGR02301 family)